MKTAYLSRGRLFLADGEHPHQLVESAFAREVKQRAVEIQQRHGWKSKGSESGFMTQGQDLWNVRRMDQEAIPIRITGVSRGFVPGEILYTLQTETVGGLFRYIVSEDREIRLFHKESFRVEDPTPHPNGEWVAACLRFANGTSNLMVVPKDRPLIDELTEGDSRDEAPAWVPGPGRKLVFQSTGVARNEAGFARGMAPSTIQFLDVETGKMETLLEDGHFDFLSPQMDAQGNLYAIRRPFEEPGVKKAGIKDVVVDTILLPFRLFRALIHFLDFISKMFSQKPLVKSGGVGVRGTTEDEERGVWIRGKYLEIAKASSAQEEDAKSWVPDNWELVKKASGGALEVLAKSVVSFDLTTKGVPGYTDGKAIYRLGSKGFEKIGKAKFMEKLALLD